MNRIPGQPQHPPGKTVSIEVPIEMEQQVREWIAQTEGTRVLQRSNAPPPAGWGLSWTSLSMTGSLLIFAGLLTSGIFYILPRFKEMFAEYKTELPTVTKILLLFAAGPWWVIFWIVALLWPIMMTSIVNRSDPQRREGVRKLLRGVTVLFLGMVVVLVVIALFAPMAGLLDNISSGKAG